jgi:mannose-6-phosphate isomerase-like protein (cupin superfamily)
VFLLTNHPCDILSWHQESKNQYEKEFTFVAYAKFQASIKLKGEIVMLNEKNYEMEIRTLSPAEMDKRVARFKDLKYPPDRYPDSLLPGHERRNYLVIGQGLIVEGGKDPLSAIPIHEGFQMSYIEAKPGNGPKLHNHDTNETFIAIKGRWRVIWGLNQEHSVDLDPQDVCAVPPFVPRRFENIEPAQGSEFGLLLAVQPGNVAKCEFM